MKKPNLPGVVTEGEGREELGVTPRFLAETSGWRGRKPDWPPAGWFPAQAWDAELPLVAAGL